MRYDAHFSMLPELAFTRAGGRLKSLEGGGGSSSSSSTTTSNTDKRQVLGAPGVQVSSDGSSRVKINALDAGAIKKVFKFATGADRRRSADLSLHLKYNNKTAMKALQLSDRAFTNAFESLDATAAGIEKAYEDAKGAGTEKTLVTIAALAVVAVIGIKAWR